jgi:hypothetical protein
MAAQSRRKLGADVFVAEASMNSGLLDYHRQLAGAQAPGC